MGNFSNSQILAAVLTKWAQPAIEEMTGGRLDNLPWVQMITNKVKSTGWVGQNWSFGREISPLLGGMTKTIVEPMIESYLSGIPDCSIPELAHSIVDKAIENGDLTLFDGNVVFEKEDLKELKCYLNWNLPRNSSPRYEVKEKGDDDKLNNR